jgi:hypothetical protein
VPASVQPPTACTPSRHGPCPTAHPEWAAPQPFRRQTSQHKSTARPPIGILRAARYLLMAGFELRRCTACRSCRRHELRRARLRGPRAPGQSLPICGLRDAGIGTRRLRASPAACRGVVTVGPLTRHLLRTHHDNLLRPEEYGARRLLAVEVTLHLLTKALCQCRTNKCDTATTSSVDLIIILQ